MTTRCWHCNSHRIKYDPTGWICCDCGQNGESKDAIPNWQQAAARNVPCCEVGTCPIDEPILRGEYVGEIKWLRGKTAIVRHVPERDDLYAVQCHDLSTGLGYGWFAFERKDWKIDE